MKKITTLIWLLYCATTLWATQNDIIPLMQRMQTIMPDSAKHQLSDSVQATVLQHLTARNALTARLDSVPFMGSIYDADSTLRIVSWNYHLQDGTYGYHAIFIKKQGRKQPLIHAFSTTQANLPTELKKYTIKNWYGSLYYRIIKHKKNYLLLGYSMYQPATRLKLIDVLSYENNKPVLGDKIFDWEGKVKRRVVFEYGSMVQMLLHYDVHQKGFIFDHLSPEEPSMQGIRAYYGPDFSYDGLFYKKRKWTYVSDLDIKNVE